MNWKPAPMLFAVILLMSACSTARRGEPFRTGPTVEKPEVDRGEVVFYRHCHQCHPGGEGGLGPALNDKPLPKAMIHLQVRSGLGAMPSFGPDQITDKEMDDLLAYLVGLRNREVAPRLWRR